MSTSALHYHLRTSYDRYRMSGHSLDWSAQPEVFKSYRDRPAFALPQVTRWPQDRISDTYLGKIEPEPETAVSLDRLATILMLTQALTAKSSHGGTDFYFRSVASAGALYPFETYVSCRNVPGLADGMYHHAVARQLLIQLGQGDYTAVDLPSAPVPEESVAAVTFFLTAIFFRSSWKYRDRAYRYHLLDTGHLGENLAQALTVSRMPFCLSYDFDDESVNDLLGLDTNREVCLAVAAGWGKAARGHEKEATHGVSGDVEPASHVSAREVDYPEIREIHKISSTVITGPGPGQMLGNLGLNVGRDSMSVATDRFPKTLGYADALFTRRSMRNFVRDQLPADTFGALVKAVCTDADARGRPLDETLAVGMLTQDVEGIEAGFYVLDRARASFNPVAYGNKMERMASVCLNQEWLGNCAIHFLFLSNIGSIERLWGARAYRYALLSAGRLGQRLYVTSSALHIGCCGIGAFYDEEAARLLELPEECHLLYLVACGPVKKRSLGRK
ncbi:MAG TPA: SagB/ThcOx family dehydrogenase [Desulfomonilaceae bacterium]|nr:SagB/ThcOx family dehydrogenase [Desulfomonilaceae bacterium]